MHKILKWIAIAILFISLLSFSNFLILYVVNGGKKLGSFTQPYISFSTYTENLIKVMFEPDGLNLPINWMQTPSDFSSINHLQQNLYVLNGSYSVENNKHTLTLSNLKTDESLHTWAIDQDLLPDLELKNLFFWHTVLLADRSIIVKTEYDSNLIRLDSNSKVVWKRRDAIFHHASNLDYNNHLWLCEQKTRTISNPNERQLLFYDNYITQIDISNGQTLFSKSIADILVENQYQGIAFGTGNDEMTGTDPFHINDIQPALTDGKYWKRDDLFISIRNRSLILVYRPENNQILYLLQVLFAINTMLIL